MTPPRPNRPMPLRDNTSAPNGPRGGPAAAARQRSDHAQENAEDYVELIGDLQRELGAAHKSDMAARLGVSHVTVHKTIKRLKSLGLVNAESYRAVTLTEEGERLAEHARERHQLVLAFLEHMGVSAEAACEDAEGIEHHVGAETLERMRDFCDQMDANGTFRRHNDKRSTKPRA